MSKFDTTTRGHWYEGMFGLLMVAILYLGGIIMFVFAGNFLAGNIDTMEKFGNTMIFVIPLGIAMFVSYKILNIKE